MRPREHKFELYGDDSWKCTRCNAIQTTSADEIPCKLYGKFKLKSGKIFMNRVFDSFEEAQKHLEYLKGNKKGKLEVVPV